MITHFDPHPMGETLRRLGVQRAAPVGLDSTKPTRLLLCSRRLGGMEFAVVEALFVPRSLSVKLSESYAEGIKGCTVLRNKGIQLDPTRLIQLDVLLPAGDVGCMPLDCSVCQNQNGWSPTALPILLPDIAPLFTPLLTKLQKGFETVLERKKAEFCWHDRDTAGHSG